MQSTAKNVTIYEFDGFRLVAGEELLLRNGEQIPLSIKAFGVLKMLVERHGHLLTKGEIIDTVWEDAFVEEGSLSRAVWTIRQALDDTSKEKFIQTVPRRGYRFVFPVSVRTDCSGAFPIQDLPDNNEVVATPFASDGLEEVVSELAASDARNASAKSIPRWAAVAGILLVLLGGIIFYLTLNRQKTLGKGETSRLVVMPLKPLDPLTRDAIYDSGIAEALITKLSADKKLSVRQLDAVRLYSDGDQDPIKIGKEQGVDYVLLAHYQLANGKIKVTVRLFDVVSGDIVEDFSTTKESVEPFVAQEALANDIGNRLLARFGSGSSEFRPELGTNNADAYRHYLTAMNLNEQRGRDKGSKALENIEQAVALDPSFARAWAAKAYIHGYFFSNADRHEHYQKSVEAVSKALAIEPNLSEAHSARCFSKFRYEYDFAGAEGACKRAIELDANSPLAHKIYSNFLYSRGKFDDSIAEIKKAMELQPVSYDNQQTFALALYFAKRYKESEAEWKRLIDLNPDHDYIYNMLSDCLIAQRKESEALEYRIKAMALKKIDAEKIERVTAAYAATGWRGVVLEQINISEAAGSTDVSVLARLYASIGNKDEAFEYLEKSYQQRSNMIAVLSVDPRLDSLRDDPRFAGLLERVEARKQ